MKTIWKFPLDLCDQQQIPMPKGAQILTLQTQNGVPCIWVMVEDDAVEAEMRTFEIFGTGTEITKEKGFGRCYIGTFQRQQFVWHVFERYVPVDDETAVLDLGRVNVN